MKIIFKNKDEMYDFVRVIEGMDGNCPIDLGLNGENCSCDTCRECRRQAVLNINELEKCD